MEIICAARSENILGEGPLWDSERATLYWVDIVRGTLHWLEPDSGTTGAWQLGVRATAIALRKDSSFLLATDRGLGVFDRTTVKLKLRLHPEPERSQNRTNDGHADARGRFWFGTMRDGGEERTGALYRLDSDWSCTRVLDGLGIPNTLLCTPDCATLYFADSKDTVLYKFSVDRAGNLSERRVFARGDESAGTPDGSALDEHGFLWNAQWGGSRIVRYAPDGSIDRIVALPVRQPTSCAFGGRALSTLFVTSARQGLDGEQLSRAPLSGNLFAFAPGVRGQPMPIFGG
jgi:sugar lactone lactonase YvrE